MLCLHADTHLCAAQILLLIRQMEATSTQALAAKVSAITIGQQAIIDAYMCLAHLTAGRTQPACTNAL